jgi:RNA polymerase sigma-70 factor (ECF subfamily)
MYSGSLSDESLVGAFLDGNEDAFAQLYERYRVRIYSAAFQIMRNPEEAQDATQDIFIKLYRSLHKWNVQKAKLSTWIYRMAVNHSIDCRRVRFRRAESQLPENNAKLIFRQYASGSSAGSPFKDIKNREEISLVRHCIENMPDQQKRTFIGRYFRELKLVEIAEQENCNISAVKSALYRATHAVRHFLLESRSLPLRKMESHA